MVSSYMYLLTELIVSSDICLLTQLKVCSVGYNLGIKKVQIILLRPKLIDIYQLESRCCTEGGGGRGGNPYVTWPMPCR